MKREKGAILIFCLVFLLVLTLMGVSSMESTILEERMAGNMQDHSVAFQAAESALQAAEEWLAGQLLLPPVSSDGSTVVWVKDAMDPAPGDQYLWWSDSNRDNAAWWQANALAVGGISGAAEPPRYIIERYSISDQGQSIAIGEGTQNSLRVFHRITARGVGGSSTAVVHLQSTHVKLYE